MKNVNFKIIAELTVIDIPDEINNDVVEVLLNSILSENCNFDTPIEYQNEKGESLDIVYNRISTQQK